MFTTAQPFLLLLRLEVLNVPKLMSNFFFYSNTSGEIIPSNEPTTISFSLEDQAFGVGMAAFIMMTSGSTVDITWTLLSGVRTSFNGTGTATGTSSVTFTRTNT